MRLRTPAISLIHCDDCAFKFVFVKQTQMPNERHLSGEKQPPLWTDSQPSQCGDITNIGKPDGYDSLGEPLHRFAPLSSGYYSLDSINIVMIQQVPDRP